MIKKINCTYLLCILIAVIALSGCVVQKEYKVTGTKMELMKRMEKALLSYGYTILYRNDEYGIIQAGIAESGGAFGMVSQGAGFYTSKPSHLKEFVSITVDNNYLFIRADSNAVSPDSWWRSRISDELPK